MNSLVFNCAFRGWWFARHECNDEGNEWLCQECAAEAGLARSCARPRALKKDRSDEIELRRLRKENAMINHCIRVPRFVQADLTELYRWTRPLPNSLMVNLESHRLLHRFIPCRTLTMVEASSLPWNRRRSPINSTASR